MAQQFYSNVQDLFGNALPSSIVTVTNYPSGTAALIYSDNALTIPIANPINPLSSLTGSTGVVQFFAGNGQYVISVNTGGVVTTYPETVVLYDPAIDPNHGPYSVASNAALRLLTASFAPKSAIVQSALAGGKVGGNLFQVVASDHSSADNGGTIIVDAAGRRWYFVSTIAVVENFGVTFNTGADQLAAFNSALASGVAGRSLAMQIESGGSATLSAGITWPVTYPLKLSGPGSGACAMNFEQTDGTDCIHVPTMASDSVPFQMSGFKVVGSATTGNGIDVATNANAGYIEDVWVTGCTHAGAAAILYSVSGIGTLRRSRLFDSSVGLALNANGIGAQSLWIADNGINVTVSGTSFGNDVHALENGLSTLDPTKQALDCAGAGHRFYWCFYEGFQKAQGQLFEASSYNNILQAGSRASWSVYDLGWDNIYSATATAPYFNRTGMYQLTGPQAASGDALQNLSFDSSYENAINFSQYGSTPATLSQSTNLGRRDLFSAKLDWGTTALSGANTSQPIPVVAGNWFKASFWIYCSRDMATNETLQVFVNGAANQNRFEQDVVGLKANRWYPIEIGWLIDTTENVTVRIALSLDSGTTHAALVTNVDDLTTSINAKEHTTVYNPQTAASMSVAFAGEYHSRMLVEQLFGLSGTNVGTVGFTTWNVVGPITPNVTTEFTASTYTIGATEFNANGSGHRGRIWINTAANGNNKQLKLYVGTSAGTNIFDSGAVALNAGTGYCDYEIKRRDTTHLLAVTSGYVGGVIEPKYTLVSLNQNTDTALTATLTNATTATDSSIESITGTSI